jgi:hypothetical protein
MRASSGGALLRRQLPPVSPDPVRVLRWRQHPALAQTGTADRSMTRRFSPILANSPQFPPAALLFDARSDR